MIPTLLAAVSAAVLRSLAAFRLDRWNLGAPAIMLVAGVATGLAVESSARIWLNTDIAQHAAEITLAVLLFVDATEVRGGRLWGKSPGLAARLLLIAMPLSLAAAMGVGALVFPELGWPVLLVLACVVVPIDFAPSERLVRDGRLSSRLRGALNVESGYNDGIVSPVFLFALVLAGGGQENADPLSALGTAVPYAVKAILVGVVVGTVLGWLLDRSQAMGWAEGQPRRIVVLLVPVIAYGTAVAVSGNGFVAAFVCGIAFRYVHRVLVARRLRRAPATQRPSSPIALSADFTLLNDVTGLLTMSMWFAVGVAGVSLLAFVDWQTLLFCALALTAVRIVPVVLSLAGSRLSGRERVLAGALGPRGTTSIVFGLLAFNGLPDGLPADTILLAMALTVTVSVFLHGVGAGPMIDGLAAPPSRRQEVA